MSDIGTRMSQLRRERDWDQSDLAQRSGISISTISRFETGKKTPTLEQQIRIAQAFGVAVTQLNPEINANNFEAAIIADMKSKQPVFEIPSRRSVGRIPLYVQNTAGILGQFPIPEAMVGEVDCPPWLAGVPDAWAIQIPEMLMSPRFRAGETIFIHPKAPIRRGDDVIVLWDQLEGPTPYVYLGTYVGVGQREFSGDLDEARHLKNAYLLRQFEAFPADRELEIPTEESKIMKVVGSLFP